MTTLAQPASRPPRTPSSKPGRAASDDLARASNDVAHASGDLARSDDVAHASDDARRAHDAPASPVAALFDAHCGFVCRVLRHHGVHEAALDDAVQDVFVTAYRRWSSFEGRSSARSWLYGIARRIAYRYRRSADARARRFVPAAEAPVEAVDEPFSRAHAAHSLAALLHELDADKRTVFVLTELEGMTAPEVAEALGIPLGTAYSRLRAAWQVLGQQAGREDRRLRRLLPSLREADPPPERRRQMWGLVAAGLRLPAEGGGTVVAAAGWLSQVKWIVVGTALGVGLLGARAAVVASQRDGDAAGAEVERAKGSRAPRSPGAAAEVEADAAEPTGVEPTGADLPGVEPPGIDGAAPGASAGASARPRSPSSAAPRPASPAAADAPAAASPGTSGTADAFDQDSLTAELALLQRARVALREGRTDDALALLDQHAERYPRGQLVDERRALETEARGPK